MILSKLTHYFVSPANLQSRVRKGKMTEERYEKAMSLVTGVLDYERFKDVDLVIEASLFSLPCHHSCTKRY